MRCPLKELPGTATDAAAGHTFARSRHRRLERRGRAQAPPIVPAVGVEHLADAARVRSADAETADGARHVPVDRPPKRILEVVPDEAAPGAKQVAERDVSVQRLGGTIQRRSFPARAAVRQARRSRRAAGRRPVAAGRADARCRRAAHRTRPAHDRMAAAHRADTSASAELTRVVDGDRWSGSRGPFRPREPTP